MQNAAPRKISLNPLARYSDVVLALAVVVIVGSMIVPIAPKMMDYLIATNIGISVAVLLAALYVSDASKLPSFPTILLLTTLFRLALNISSTRLILLEANAGDIIFAFGNFVVQGNFVVGGVVFVVLVLVQFIVITKGAERVAEVSARFTLDAMPGKQMSIDAEQRSGALTNEQARKRRQDLERESKLYGAMDGAMKFVKGDAIAAICIAIVNIVGGLVIGVTQMKMSPAEAAQTFSLLTIGDGLVSQIPSLLVGVAAGLVVTRVAGAKEEDQPTHVAGDIVEQIFGQWKAVAITCILLCALATTHPITGLPWGPFLVLAGVLAFGAMGQHAMRILRGEPAEPEPAADLLSTPPAAVSIVLSREVASLIFPENEPRQRRELVRQLEEARDRVARDAGVPIGALNVNEAAQGVPPGGYGLMIYETLVESAVLPRGKELRPGDAAEILVSHLARLLRRHAAEFLGIHETRILFERLEKTHAGLVSSVPPDCGCAPGTAA
jgi:type III secretion protein V